LPKPKDERVKIREVPAKKVAVIRYSGTWSEENYSENEMLLYQFLKERGYEIKGKPLWARYDPPFMPWLFRRNEIMIEIN
jgi:effector-binding domain-containing protein